VAAALQCITACRHVLLNQHEAMQLLAETWQSAGSTCAPEVPFDPQRA
jgi:hypothetical protein